MAWLTERRPAWGAELLPAIVQDAERGTVLQLAWMNREALEATERTGLVHFWSRSRRRLWRKGETSGNELRVRGLAVDCDGDAILVRVTPTGPACHTGRRSCFDAESELPAPGVAVLVDLARTIDGRRGADRSESYTARLLAGGPRRPAEKVIEEAGETAAAALAGSDDEVAAEAADLVYHLLVLLAAREVGLGPVLDVLADRRR